MAGQAAGPDPLHRAGQSVGERLQRELQQQTERRVLERRDLLHTARGNGTRRAVEAAVQYRPTPSCPRRTTPRPRDDKTIALVPQDAPTPGTTDGSGSNIGSGTATGGTSISLLCETSDDVCGRADAGFSARSAAFDLTSAGSPARLIRVSYVEGLIDGDVNPLLERNQGRLLADGWTGAGEATADIQLIPRVAVQVRPRVWYSRPTGTSSDEGATLLDAYVRGVFAGIALEVGRNHVASGHGRLAGPLLSHNARGLDMVRVSHDRAARLPWVLGALGSFTGAAWIADLGGDRLIRHGKLIVFEASLRPSRSVEIGLTLLNN